MQDPKHTVVPPRPEDAIKAFLDKLGIVEPQHELNFRGLLTMVGNGEVGSAPNQRLLTLAGVALLLHMGRCELTLSTRVANMLNCLKDEFLAEASVAIVNGATLVVPDENNEPAAYNLITFEKAKEIPIHFVATLYSISALWKCAGEAIRLK